MFAPRVTKDAPSLPFLLLVLTALTSLSAPATGFLCHSRRQPFITRQPSDSFDMSSQFCLQAAASDHSASSSTSDTITENSNSNIPALLQAKLHILEDVVVKLNGTKFQDQEEIKTLQSKLGNLEETLAKQKDQFEEKLEASKSQVQGDLTAAFQSERMALKTKHADELQGIKDKIEMEALEEQDAIEQRQRQETEKWKIEKEKQWQESLEIATAAVKAGEARENVLQTKLDNLEQRYQQEAAEYKDELNQLRSEWKSENARLETEVGRLQGELSDAKLKRDSESTRLVEQLGDRSRELETELTRTKLKFVAQNKKAHSEWEEQREKERKFYTEAMRLLQQENRALREKQGFWGRLFRLGSRPFRKSTGSSRRPIRS